MHTLQNTSLIPDFEAHASEPLQPYAWLEDGRFFTIVEDGIVCYNCSTGAREELIPLSALIPQGSEKPLTIDGVEWSSDGSKALLRANGTYVWREKTRSEVWIWDRANRRLWAAGGGNNELRFPKFSPDGTRIAYFRNNDIFVEAVEPNAPVTQLTFSPDSSIINGTSDWVYEEELHLRDCFLWSPDGTKIAYLQFDVSGVGEFAMIRDTGGLYPEVQRWAYPKVGTTNASVRLGFVPAGGGETRWVAFPGDPRENYLARFEWIPRRRNGMSGELLVQRLNREQTRNDLWLIALRADTEEILTSVLFTETDDAWINSSDTTRWFAGGERLVWASERDGWNHLYALSLTGELTLLTPGAFDAIGIAGLDGSLESARHIYFIASPDDATRRYLYRVPLDGSGTAERITPAEFKGANGYVIAPSGAVALHTFSNFETPPHIALITLPAHTPIVTIRTDDAQKIEQNTTPFVPVEFFSIDIGDDVTLDGWMLKPHDFDPDARYPVIVYIYGEPASTTVVDRWTGANGLWHRYMANLGYLVVSFDNRGAKVPKGRAWRKARTEAIGFRSIDEQAAAIRALAAERKYVDIDRVGIWGHSGGGSNTLHALFRYPELFRVGIALAPVPDKSLYDTVYQERYMSTPQNNPEGYQRSSAIFDAEGLQGKLLLVHGTADDNCHFLGTLRLVDRLIELNKQFDLMIYPERKHSLKEGKGTSMHLFTLKTRYFTEHLPRNSSVA